MIFSGTKLKAIRKEQGVKVKEFKEIIGASTASMWAWENGTDVPNANYLAKLSELYKVPLDAFYIK